MSRRLTASAILAAAAAAPLLLSQGTARAAATTPADIVPIPLNLMNLSASIDKTVTGVDRSVNGLINLGAVHG